MFEPIPKNSLSKSVALYSNKATLAKTLSAWLCEN
jgi:hypothetical protein